MLFCDPWSYEPSSFQKYIFCFLSQCLYNLLTLNPVSAWLSGYMQKPVSHTNQQKLCAIHKSDSAQFVFIFNSPSVSTDLLRRDTWLCVAGCGLPGRRVNIIPVNAQMMFGSRVQGHLSSAINESGSVSLSGDDCKINEEPFHIQGHIISLRCILAYLFTVSQWSSCFESVHPFPRGHVRRYFLIIELQYMPLDNCWEVYVSYTHA